MSSNDGRGQRHEDINIKDQYTINGGETRNGRLSQIKNDNEKGHQYPPNEYRTETENEME
ncbi:hypothetical protein [Paenibacillus gansuensis]|uniref:Uncharacterized protein n=1 Tax=Paenibacillus gansuensis TaxID=306542 RepID=A0ABW5PAD4_9BACL